jgi:oligoendopeptidase F
VVFFLLNFTSLIIKTTNKGGAMRILPITLTILFVSITTINSQTLERDQVEDKYKWNLTDIYPTAEAWQADVDMLKVEIDKLADFKGTLGVSSESLLKALKTGNDLVKTLYRAWVYANNVSNENLNISENQAMVQQMNSSGKDRSIFERTT